MSAALPAIRPATLDDLDAIMALERASFPTDAWSAGMMHDELASPHGRYFVLQDAGAIVGYGGIRALTGAKDADIQTIAIAEAVRGRGCGRALLNQLLHEAAARGAREVFLDVRADNPVAQSLYAKTGFAEIGRRPRYYQPDDVDAIVMRLDLRAAAESALSHPAHSSRSAGRTADRDERSGGLASAPCPTTEDARDR